MSEERTPYTVATLAFPDTRLTSERLWVSSALSVLRAREHEHMGRHEWGLAILTRDTIALLARLEATLRLREEEEHASTD